MEDKIVVKMNEKNNMELYINGELIEILCGISELITLLKDKYNIKQETINSIIDNVYND